MDEEVLAVKVDPAKEVARCRKRLKELLRRSNGERISLPAPLSAARHVVNALRSDGRQVLSSDDQVLRWEQSAAAGSQGYAVIEVLPRLYKDERAGWQWWG